MSEQEKLISELREAAGDHAHGEGYLAGLLKRGAAAIKALHAEAEALDVLCQSRFDEIAQLKAEAEALRAELSRRDALDADGLEFRKELIQQRDSALTELEAARGLPRDIRHANRANPSCQYEMEARVDAFLTSTPAPEVQDEQAQCDRDLELFGVSFSVRGRRVDPADVVWRMKHADVGPEVSRYNDFRGDNKWLVSSASSLLALDEKGALTGGGIGGHARTIIASLAARLMQHEDRKQSSQAEQGERQEVWARQCDLDESDQALFVARERVEESGYTVRLTTSPQPGPDVRGMVEALEHARLFIRNGVELGYIKMPDADTPDPAHETLPKIDAALAAHRQAQQGDSHDT